MAKRKAISSSGSEEEYEKSPKKSKSSINHSIIQAANFMSKNQALHKSLNLSSNLLFPDSNGKIKKQSKGKKKEVGTSESEDEINVQTIPKHKKHEDINATNSSFEKERKSKSPKKRISKDKSYDAFTPKLEPKEEIIEGLEIFDTISPEDSNLNASSNQNTSRHSNSNIEQDDVNMMNSIEEKVQKVRILQDVRISPSQDPKQQLRDIYPNLQQLHLKTKINLGDSDEIFLFRTPKNVDIQNLLNASIDIEDGGKINIGEKYIIRPTSKIPHPTLLLSSLSNIFRFKKNIVMEKYTKPPKSPKLPIKEETVMPLPNNLKNRHPLFGNNYEEKLQLDETVEKKLSSAIKNLLKQKKKATKKELKRDLEEDNDELVFSLLETKTVTEKQKPDKNVPLTPHKSAKKKKLTKSDLIEETLRLMKQELHTEYESDCETSLPKKKKKKKKSHSISGVNVKEEVENETECKGITPKALRRISLANSTMLPNSSKMDNFNPELSYISGVFSEELIFSKEKKKKKTKHVPFDVDIGEESTYHLPLSKKLDIKEEPIEDSPVKKKKKKNLY